MKGKKNAIDEELVGREKIGLRERGVSDHPELELRGGGESGGGGGWGGGGNLHGEDDTVEEEREMKEGRKEGRLF